MVIKQLFRKYSTAWEQQIFTAVNDSGGIFVGRDKSFWVIFLLLQFPKERMKSELGLNLVWRHRHSKPIRLHKHWACFLYYPGL